MMLDALCDSWQIDIVASDISTRALRAAAAGVWPIEKTRLIPRRYLRRSMLEGFGTQTGRLRVSDSIRRHVRFFRANLHSPDTDPHGPFDLILCRNVLIYFDPHARTAIVERLVERCAPGVYLFLGHS
jgi:chemotaxis protein methyltransferase CheR